MSYQAEIAFIITAGHGAQPDVFDRLLGVALPAYADDERLSQEVREELVEFFEDADVRLDDGIPVMHYHAPFYKCSGVTTQVLNLLEGLTEYAAESGLNPCSGASCFLGEDKEVDVSSWGDDEWIMREMVEPESFIRLGWTDYGIHIDAHDIRSFLVDPAYEEDVCRICDEAIPEIRELLKKKAEELGYRRKTAIIV